MAGRTGRTWVIDPIDGTKAFAQGVPLFATLLALIDDRGPAAGVIFLPALDECVWAGRGRGAHWDGEAVPSQRPLRLRGVLCLHERSLLLAGPRPAEGSSRRCPGANLGRPPPVTPSWRPGGRRPWSTLNASTGMSPRCPSSSPRPGAGSRTQPAQRTGAAAQRWSTNGILHDDLLGCFRDSDSGVA